MSDVRLQSEPTGVIKRVNTQCIGFKFLRIRTSNARFSSDLNTVVGFMYVCMQYKHLLKSIDMGVQ